MPRAHSRPARSSSDQLFVRAVLAFDHSAVSAAIASGANPHTIILASEARLHRHAGPLSFLFSSAAVLRNPANNKTAAAILAVPGLFSLPGAPDINQTLLDALMSGAISCAETLLLLGADPNHADSLGISILHILCSIEHTRSFSSADIPAFSSAIRTAIALGADIGKRHPHGNLCIHSAGPAAASILLELGADPNSSDLHGRSPLHWAATSEHAASLIPIFASAGADPNITDEIQQTPLHSAASAGNLSAAIALVDAGASPHTLDRERKSPTHIAISCRNLGRNAAWCSHHDTAAVLLAASELRLLSSPTQNSSAHRHSI